MTARGLHRALAPGLPVGALLLCLLAAVRWALPAELHAPWAVTVIVLGILSILAGIRRNQPPPGSGWQLFGAGLTFYAASDVAYVLLSGVVGADHPVVTAAWLIGLAGVPVVVAGLRRVLASGDRQLDLEARLDAAVVAVAVGYVGWHALVGPLVDEVGFWSFAVVGSTTFWMAAVVALGLVLHRGLVRGASTPSLWLFVTAIPLTALTSLVYWTQERAYVWESAPIARTLMALSYAAGAAAVWHPSMRRLGGGRETADLHPSRLLIVAFGAAVAPLWHSMAAVGYLEHPGGGLIGGGLELVLTGLVMTRVAVTWRARETARRQLHAREARFRSLVEHAFEGVAILDAAGRTIWTATPRPVSGRPGRETVGALAFDAVHPDDEAEVRRRFELCVADPSAKVFGRARIRHVGGRYRWIEYHLVNQLGNPSVAGVVANYRDVTEHHDAQHQLARQALHDAVTGLPNRAQLMERMRVAMIAPGSRRLAVLFLDLDRFKVVNESLGHHVGDRLLVAVADRLRTAVDDGAVIARIGGDEFVVLCESRDGEAEALSLAARLCDVLAVPFHLAGHEVVTTASIGIALHGPGSETPDELLRDADAAMYRAKEEGRDGFALFDGSLRQAATSRLAIEGALRRALRGDDLTLHYQPIVSLRDGAVARVEALLRWKGPGRDLAPVELIRVAEETGLIGPLGDWVIRRAVADLGDWYARNPDRLLSVAVNVSGAQLRRPGFAVHVRRALRDSGLPATAFGIELTESVVIDDAATANSNLATLRLAGVHIAMDDFGTGYSALANLKRIPFHVVKIDRSFVDGLGTDPEDTAIVEAVVGMAHALGLEVVGEGVETPGQTAALRDLGCDYAQGYHLGRPVPFAELEERLAAPQRAAWT